MPRPATPGKRMQGEWGRRSTCPGANGCQNDVVLFQRHFRKCKLRLTLPRLSTPAGCQKPHCLIPQSPPTTRINLHLKGQRGCLAQPRPKGEEAWTGCNAGSSSADAAPTHAHLRRQPGEPWRDTADRSSVLTSVPRSSPFSISPSRALLPHSHHSLKQEVSGCVWRKTRRPGSPGKGPRERQAAEGCWRRSSFRAKVGSAR